MKKLSEDQAISLIVWGASKLPLFNGALEESDELRHLSNKQMVVIATTYAAALASHTKLDLEEFLSFCSIAFQNVEVTDGDHSSRTEGGAVRPADPGGAGSPPSNGGSVDEPLGSSSTEVPEAVDERRDRDDG